MGSGLVGFHLKDMLASKLFTASRNWLDGGGAISIESARPQQSKYQNTENKSDLNRKALPCSQS